jgi:hypothetical protein
VRTELFKACDLVIESNLPLPELRRAPGETPRCCFELLPDGDALGGEFDWFHHWQMDDEEPWLKFAVVGEEYLLRFPSQADFFVSRDTRRVKCRPLTGTPEFTIRHLFLDQVVPLILSRRETLVLHASAVLTDYGVTGFVGASGTGKSTLAAHFGMSGSSLVCDDCLVLRQRSGVWLAVPSYPGVRLWDAARYELFESPPESANVAHYTSKQRVSSSLIPCIEPPAAIQCLYFLGGDRESLPGAFAVEPIAPRDAFLELLSFSFNLDVGEKAYLAHQFRAIDKLLTDVPCYRLRYPRDFSALPAVREMIRDHQTRNAQCLSR